MSLKKILLTVLIISLIPFIIVYDSLFYLMTRPSCLNCGNLIEFLRNSSLTIMLLSGVGYKLNKNK
ncbi:hypothetical protein A3J15_03675 [Candidatus Roizmanbacteria bacterium RIFCSPLOWO2_02_FULL_38_10]|uniref:Uncharacterized protein n=1 Tax=Candidatus Roizmanbacteria bacterium RIFCSPLOWO2_02_FULL_38_10 TaxID=1802074 RepID=A0A1F7JND7_9BACT|nr:MAG: hypothetical protein A3J15_03675 [Candidatus Roizmanbacteria bacterium RIFCSPLOWO2_02_FULL_38_10]